MEIETTKPPRVLPVTTASLRPEQFEAHRAVVASAAVFGLLCGLLCLLGWALSIPRLTDWVGTGISMFPNTALCACMSGMALLLLAPRAIGSQQRVAVDMLGVCVLLIGGATLFQHATSINLGIDTLFLQRPWGQLAAAAPMRMGPPASFSFFVLGVGLLLATRGARARWFASCLAVFPAAIASLSLIGYWFGSDKLYTIVHLTGIAIQTSIILAVLGIGLMAAVPEHGIVWLLRRNDSGGMLVRSLLLPIIAIPLLLGWLRVVGQDVGLYDAGFGRSILLLSTIAMLLALLVWTASSISRAETALRERQERYELVLVGAEAAIWDWDVVNQRVLYSPRWKQLRGLAEHEVGQDEKEWSQGIHPADRDRVMTAVEAHFAGRTAVFAEEYRVQHKDGHYLWVLDRGIARRDATGRVVRMAGSETDITERKQLEEKLRQQLNELAEVDRHKNEFLATLAHELRNPLAPIRNGVNILQLSDGDDASAKTVLEIMDRQVVHMVRLVDDLMEMSRISSGKISLRKAQVDITEILRTAVETSKPLIETRNHQLHRALPQQPLLVSGDPVRLAQVIANLLNNAAKYTEPGGQIWLSAARHRDRVVITVRDTGIGITAGMQPQLFRMFAQVDRDGRRAQGGLGIGLALVKKLVEMHGGTVEVRSAGAGQGSEFTVRLPLSAVDVPGGEMPTDPANSPLPPPTGHRVLIVDDNQDAANTLAMQLRLQGHEVQVVYSGEAALQLTASYLPDVVFLDLGMPGLDGCEVARRMRKQQGLERVVLAALTGWGQPDDRRRTTEAGFDFHLVKPPESQAIEKVLASLVSAEPATAENPLPAST